MRFGGGGAPMVLLVAASDGRAMLSMRRMGNRLIGPCYANDSTIMAIPCPPPMHAEASP
jgi:hypothetical protein